MIDSPALLKDLKKLLPQLERDLRTRLDEDPALAATLQQEWQQARDAKRTAATLFDWQSEALTQSAVHWILACVFLRFLEDNDFLDEPLLCAPDAARQALVRDRYQAYFVANPVHSDRDYLLQAFATAAALPGLAGLFDARHNPLHRLLISGDGAIALLGFFRRIAPDTGALVHDFTDPERRTRFLGDLYQDLSESAKKRYALLQTPSFVEEFILDRTLTPAIETFGFREVRMIDPACGSGHFLLGGFQRLFRLWATAEPGRNLADLAQRALDGVYGVDLNPFAVEIARFRLLVAALNASSIMRLRNAPDFQANVATGDSLLHGTRFSMSNTGSLLDEADSYRESGLAHAYAVEDVDHVNAILGKQYHAVVGNPPYVIVKDAALNAAYRERYASCHRQYSLGVPFTERFFELAFAGDGRSAGYIGLITANSFMKREFGSKLIETVLSRLDLTHVIDTSGAYIPGHGTPTAILLGRHRAPPEGPQSEGSSVRAVMGIKGEPSKPNDATRGLVWRAIVEQTDRPGSQSDFVSVVDSPRAAFAKHPWSIGGGGASELKEALERPDFARLGDLASGIGFFQDTHADEVFVQPTKFFARTGGLQNTRFCIRGDGTRDWSLRHDESIFFPYDKDIEQWAEVPNTPSLRWLWAYRTTLWSRAVFSGETYRAAGRPWWDYHQFPKERARAELLVGYGEIATHNHFVLDRGGKVFNRTAPVIVLRSGTGETAYLGILGLLNSSTVCFWLQQVCHNKGRPGADIAGADERYEMRYSINAGNVSQIPICSDVPINLAACLDKQARQLSALRPTTQLSADVVPTRAILDTAGQRSSVIRGKLVSQQEELDWQCYRFYGLLSQDSGAEYVDVPPELQLGQRAFEIVLARRMGAGAEETTWFTRHGSTPITELPAHWPADYRAVVERRIALIESDRQIGLIERPEYKRRWNSEPWAEAERRALREWLLDRLEGERHWAPRAVSEGAAAAAERTPQLRSVAQLADAVRADADFMQVAALYAGDEAFDVTRLVGELVAAESVPALAALRYTEDGLRKRAAWEQTWALQREEDARGVTLDIPVPPKYAKTDFQGGDAWRLRGPLDVPKERFIAYPAATPDGDGTLLVGWAGWTHLQQATALAAQFLALKEQEAWGAERLVPVLAALGELVPWLRQWHNELDPVHGARMGDYFAGFVQDEARALGVAEAALAAWRPSASARGRGRSRTTRRVAAAESSSE